MPKGSLGMHRLRGLLKYLKGEKSPLLYPIWTTFVFNFFKPILLLHKALCNIVIPLQMQLKSMFEAFLKGSRLQTHLTSSPEDLPVLGISQVIF